MIKKIKDIILKTDQFFYKKFGSSKSFKQLENIKEVKFFFSCLYENQQDDKIKFVGGCVRKALTGETIDDIDLATSLTPEEIKNTLEKNAIKVIDTGISHGTVTAIINNKKFEITTLRRDVSTDGRHADVKFTLNWEEDASRRDFTINTIYSDISGRIFDPFNGIEDLKNGKIQFVGLPEKRIQEDYLRILRYFRFFTQYSKNNHDLNILQSIKKNINGMNQISNERIYDEVTKILKLKNLFNLFLDEKSREIILNIFPQFQHYLRLKIFNNMDEKLRSKYDTELILALLILDESKDFEYFCHKYKTSNSFKNRLKNISDNFENFSSKKFYNDENINKLIYLLGKNNVIDLLLFSICINKKMKNNVIEIINMVDKYKVPKFPISGDYLQEYGYKTGEKLGKKLKLLEEEWINNNFKIDKKKIQKSLEKINKN